MDAAVLEAECDDAAALAVLHQQVQREVLHKVVAVIPVRILGSLIWTWKTKQLPPLNIISHFQSQGPIMTLET